jgi:HSP20 family molecular chaperone IbpA
MNPPVKEKGKTGDAPGKEGAFPYRLSFDGNRAHIIADLTGVGEEKIRLDLEKATLVISTTDGECKQVGIVLPWAATLATKRFRKGILELTLEKTGR